MNIIKTIGILTFALSFFINSSISMAISLPFTNKCKKPDWLENSQIEGHHIGIGSATYEERSEKGDAKITAKERAIIDLGLNAQVIVTSSAESTQSETVKNGRSSSSISVQERVRAVTSQLLKEPEERDYWNDKCNKEVYVRMAIPISQTKPLSHLVSGKITYVINAEVLADIDELDWSEKPYEFKLDVEKENKDLMFLGFENLTRDLGRQEKPLPENPDLEKLDAIIRQATGKNKLFLIWTSGFFLYSQEQYRRAILKFKEALNIAAKGISRRSHLSANGIPADWLFIQGCLGDAYYHTEQYDEAIPYLKKSIEMHEYLRSFPKNGLWQRRVRVLPEEKIFYELAVSYIDSTYIYLGSIYIKTGEIEKAIRVLEELSSKVPESIRAYHYLGIAYLEIQNYPNALENFLIFQEKYPDSAVANNNLGYALLLDGKIDEAIPYFTRALSIDENYDKPNFNLGLAHTAKQNTEQASTYFRNACDLEFELACNNIAENP